METQSKRLIAILEEIITVMKVDRDEPTVYYREFLEYMLGKLNKPHVVAEIAQDILSVYGGMCTFGDVNIYKDGVYSEKDDDRFSKLRTELQDFCEDIIVADRNK